MPVLCSIWLIDVVLPIFSNELLVLEEFIFSGIVSFFSYHTTLWKFH